MRAVRIALAIAGLLAWAGCVHRPAAPARETLPAARPRTLQIYVEASLAAGDPVPANARTLTYLHPNAPRLLFFVCLATPPTPHTGGHAPDSVVLAAYLADSADGAILWSQRIATRRPISGEQLRLLAMQLLANFPGLPPG